MFSSLPPVACDLRPVPMPTSWANDLGSELTEGCSSPTTHAPTNGLLMHQKDNFMQYIKLSLSRVRLIGKHGLGDMNWCYTRHDGFFASCLIWDVNLERCRLLSSASWLSYRNSWLDKMFHITCNTLEHSCIMQNASYFVSNCVSIGHNVGGPLLFFMALNSENRSLVSCRITKATHFLATEKWHKKCVQFSWNILLYQRMSFIKKKWVSYCGLQWPFYLSTTHRLFSTWLRSNCFNQGWVNTTQFNFTVMHSSYSISKQEGSAHCLSANSLPTLHWINPISLLPCEVWVGVAGSSGVLVVLTE